MATPIIQMRASEVVGIGIAARLTAALRDQETPPELEDSLYSAVHAASAMAATLCEEGGFDTTTGKKGLCILAMGDRAVSMTWDMDMLVEIVQAQTLPDGWDSTDLWGSVIQLFRAGKAAQSMYTAFVWLGSDYIKERAQEVRDAAGEGQFPVTIVLVAEHVQDPEQGLVLCSGIADVVPLPTVMLSAEAAEPEQPQESAPAPKTSLYVPPGHSIN